MVQKGLIIVFSFAALGYTLPTNCEICSYAIDNYAANGGGAPNLGTPVKEARDYARIGAQTIQAKYPSANATYAKAAENQSCQFWTFTPQYTWSCNFLIYSGHAGMGGFFLGNGTGYKWVV